ncbi:hypothetical protein QTG56_24005 (plasmid) [Rossellomorea sp. AcN35-11]|nr:hypothetical protein [Rossellomorea aquimaris]WJV31703.1 hypothetical protein QTG56_24005 [Rossellomorea sp. AcN35-11]
MNEVFIVKILSSYKDCTEEKKVHGTFTTCRGASQWLVDKGFEPFLKNEGKEYMEDESTTFVSTNKTLSEMHSAKIERLAIQKQQDNFGLYTFTF